MATEIERKYRVLRMEGADLGTGVPIDQGYLSSGAVTVRVRTKGERGFLTIKGPTGTHASGALSRAEFEYEIPVADARELLNMALRRLQKTRHTLPSGIEIDVFHGAHDGLVLAEFESADGAGVTAPPGVEWIEVTDDRRYSNSWIAENGIPNP